MKQTVSLLAALVLLISCTANKIEHYKIALLGLPPNDLEPLRASEVHEVTLLGQMCARLTSINESANILGDVAYDWKISSDGLEYQFFLNRNRHFSNDKNLTADDVVYSLIRAKTYQNSLLESWLQEVSNIKKFDDYTVQISLNYQNPNFLYKIAHPRFCILNREEPFVQVQKTRVPNSAGAYSVRNIDKNILLKINDDFKDIAKEEYIQVDFYEQEDAIVKFNEGKIDDLSFYILEDDDISKIAIPKKIIETQYFWSWVVSLNPTKEHFNSVNKRKKFISQIDKERFIELWDSNFIPGYSIIPKGIMGHVGVIPESLLMEEKAKISCKEPLIVTVISGMPAALRLQEAVKKTFSPLLSCELKINFLKMGEFSQDRYQGKSDIYIFGIASTSLDPLSYYRYYVSGSKESDFGYSYPPFEKKYNELSHVPFNLRDVKQYEQLHHAFYESSYALVLGYPRFKFVYRDNVKDIYLNPISMYWNKWWLSGRK